MMIALLAVPQSEPQQKPSRAAVKLHLLWLTCAAAGFAVTALVACALALSSAMAGGGF
jgi:hypothetical protein